MKANEVIRLRRKELGFWNRAKTKPRKHAIFSALRGILSAGSGGRTRT
jgi:hypothetical protein